MDIIIRQAWFYRWTNGETYCKHTHWLPYHRQYFFTVLSCFFWGFLYHISRLWPLTISFVETKSIAIVVCSVATLSAIQEGFYMITENEPKWANFNLPNSYNSIRRLVYIVELHQILLLKLLYNPPCVKAHREDYLFYKALSNTVIFIYYINNSKIYRILL